MCMCYNFPLKMNPLPYLQTIYVNVFVIICLHAKHKVVRQQLHDDLVNYLLTLYFFLL